MTARTNTTAQQSFHRPGLYPTSVNEQAIFTFDTDPSRPGLTQITLPEKSTWTPGLHWHEQHVEYFRVIKGRVLIRIDGQLKLATPADGNIRVEKFQVHEFMRADRDKPDVDKDAGEVVTEEWTDPADGIKHVFFRNIFSIIQDGEYWKSWTPLQALYVAASYDDFVEFVPGRLSYATTHTIYAITRVVGKLLGLKPWYDEYTPEDLRDVARGAKMSKVD